MQGLKRRIAGVKGWEEVTLPEFLAWLQCGVVAQAILFMGGLSLAKPAQLHRRHSNFIKVHYAGEGPTNKTRLQVSPTSP